MYDSDGRENSRTVRDESKRIVQSSRDEYRWMIFQVQNDFKLDHSASPDDSKPDVQMDMSLSGRGRF